MGKSETFCMMPANKAPPTQRFLGSFGTGVNLTMKNATQALMTYMMNAEKQMTPMVLMSEMEMYDTILSKTNAGMKIMRTMSEHARAAVTPNKPFLVRKKPVPMIMYIRMIGLTAAYMISPSGEPAIAKNYLWIYVSKYLCMQKETLDDTIRDWNNSENSTVGVKKSGRKL